MPCLGYKDVGVGNNQFGALIFAVGIYMFWLAL